jgi:DNA mismatch endonuclease (patch repair protein)
MDVHSPERRSKNMQAVRSKNTNPEIVVRKLIFAKGLRFRLHDKTLPGTPDIVLAKYRAVIFVHGCFWHGHNCHLFKSPATRPDFWREKLDSNRDRDTLHRAALREAGWRVLVVWECALKGRFRLEEAKLAGDILKWVRNDEGNEQDITEISFRTPE